MVNPSLGMKYWEIIILKFYSTFIEACVFFQGTGIEIVRVEFTIVWSNFTEPYFELNWHSRKAVCFPGYLIPRNIFVVFQLSHFLSQ